MQTQTIENRQPIIITLKGQKIFGVLHRPIDVEGQVPALVICPGFAGNKCGKYRIFVEIAQELAKSGVAVLRFDYRGAGDSEGDFSEITIESQVEDVMACLNFLKSDPRIDENRIGLLGRSLGGMIAILSANRFPNIRSLALWASVYSGEQWKKNWDTEASDSGIAFQQGILKNLPSNIPAIPSMAFLKEFFTVDLKTNLEGVQHIPLLNIHGIKDEFVKYEHALAYQAVRQGNEQTLFIQLPNSNHDFSTEEERKFAIKETTQWFLKTLF